MKRERRESLRVTVDLWVEERTGDAVYFQRATNLSLGGVFLHGTLPHPPGTAVELDLHLPGVPRPVAVLGVVVLSPLGRGMGVRFTSLTREARRQIAAICREAPARAASVTGRAQVA